MEQMSLFFDTDPLADAVIEAIEAIAAKPARYWRWPRLDASVFEDLRGAASKFDANLAALKELRVIESCGNLTQDYRRILTRYTGWGGLPQVFGKPPEAWAARVACLRGLLSEEQLESAEGSTLNAHYTSPQVIEAMWKLAVRLGFKGGNILEPGAGVGYFAGFAPDEVEGHFTLVELDGVSAKIARTLYHGGQCTVVNGGFEHLECAEQRPGLVIGNVPFGNYHLGGDCRKYGGFTIHNHFIAKSLAMLEPGGVAILVTSAYTLDSKDAAARKFFAEHANLVGAIRLPNIAFKRIAGTEAVTDILVFNKPINPDCLESAPRWLDTVPIEGEGLSGQINAYFAAHPEAVVGQLAMTSNGYGKVLGAVFGGDRVEYEAALEAQVARFPQGVCQTLGQAIEGGLVLSGNESRFGFEVRDGQVWRWEGRIAFPYQAPAAVLSRIEGLCKVRDALRALLPAQQAGDAHGEREALNDAYNAFVKAHGPISATMPRRAFRRDPDLPLLLSLERIDEESGRLEKAAIFDRNTCARPDAPVIGTLEDAMTYVEMNFGVNMDAVASLLGNGETPSQLTERALLEGLLFKKPGSDRLVLASEYLSGDVKTKLDEAKAAGAEFSVNVSALESVLPADIAPSDIDVQIGADWIPAADYIAYAMERMDVRINAHLVKGLGWTVECNVQMYVTEKVTVQRLLESAMNGQGIKITKEGPDKRRVVDAEETLAAREKLDALKADFVSWLWSDAVRAERLAAVYNDRHNRHVVRVYDGSRMQLPGYSWFLTPRPHQMNAAYRIVKEDAALLAHVVGAGKTLTMIIGGMEAKRLGAVKKPLFVVPNHMLYQFGAEFTAAYPDARLLLAEKDDLVGSNRHEFVARVATGDWDGVIMTHATFERIPTSDEWREEYISDVLADIKEAVREAKGSRGKNKTVKELQLAMRVWEARLEAIQNVGKKDSMLAFEDLGVDALFVDEAHLFKNLWRFSRMERVAGLGGNNSERAFDLLMKARLMQKNGGKLVFATGTPVSNTMAEVWVMQTFLQPHIAGDFDPWANRFGRVVTNVEIAPDGSGFRMNNRFAKFVNVPELMAAFRCVADIQTAEMLKLPTPDVERKTETLPMSVALRMYTEALMKRAEAIRKGNVDPSKDNMLSVTNDGRKAALDARLVSYPGGEKVGACAANIVAEWRASAALRGTQMVFCDLSTPSDAFNVYDALKDALVDRGIPASEIAYIHQASTDAAKAALFAKVRSGDVRVLCGSTSKMGMGTNVQQRLIALHHLDVPWRPSDVEQREGRIVRQGNTNPNVRIYRYVTEGSFDAYMWQTLETKARFIAQVMRGDGVRSMDDLESGALSYAEVKAIASGNPVVMEKVKVDADVAKYTLLRDRWLRDVGDAKRTLAFMPERVVGLQHALQHAERNVELVACLPEAWTLECKDGTLSGEAISKRLAAVRTTVSMFQRQPVGRIGPYAVQVGMEKSVFGFRSVLYLMDDDRQAAVIEFRADAGSTKAALTRWFNSAQAEVDKARERITQNAAWTERLKRQATQGFEYEAVLCEAMKRQREIDRELGLHDDAPAMEVDVA